MTLINQYIEAALAGLIPALIWLWFWRREDRRRPEPRRLIFLAFVGGMIAVPIAIPVQQWVASVFLGTSAVEQVFASNFAAAAIAVAIWAAIEEVLKLAMAVATVLWRNDVDEPIDPMIYMISSALGFSALENILFLFNPISQANLPGTIITGDLRFIGASLVHISASAVVGFLMALSFYRRPAVKRLFLAIGLILSIGLHTLFNFFIILSQGPVIFIGFAVVWIAIILVLAVFEKAKRIHP